MQTPVAAPHVTLQHARAQPLLVPAARLGPPCHRCPHSRPSAPLPASPHWSALTHCFSAHVLLQVFKKLCRKRGLARWPYQKPNQQPEVRQRFSQLRLKAAAAALPQLPVSLQPACQAVPSRACTPPSWNCSGLEPSPCAPPGCPRQPFPSYSCPVPQYRRAFSTGGSSSRAPHQTRQALPPAAPLPLLQSPPGLLCPGLDDSESGSQVSLHGSQSSGQTTGQAQGCLGLLLSAATEAEGSASGRSQRTSSAAAAAEDKAPTGSIMELAKVLPSRVLGHHLVGYKGTT